MEKAPAIADCVRVIFGIIGIFVMAVRWARKSSKRAAFLGWGLQL